MRRFLLVGWVFFVFHSTVLASDVAAVLDQYQPFGGDPLVRYQQTVEFLNGLRFGEPVVLFDDEGGMVFWLDGQVRVVSPLSSESFSPAVDDFGRLLVPLTFLPLKPIAWIDVQDGIVVGGYQDEKEEAGVLWGKLPETRVMAVVKKLCGCWDAQVPGGRVTYACKPEDCGGGDPPNCGNDAKNRVVQCYFKTQAAPPRPCGPGTAILTPFAPLILMQRRCRRFWTLRL